MFLQIDKPGFSRNLIAFSIGLVVLLLVLRIVKWLKELEKAKHEKLRIIKRSARVFDEFLKL